MRKVWIWRESHLHVPLLPHGSASKHASHTMEQLRMVAGALPVHCPASATASQDTVRVISPSTVPFFLPVAGQVAEHAPQSPVVHGASGQACGLQGRLSVMPASSSEPQALMSSVISACVLVV